MPELPEVELCRRSLLRWTSGRVVTAVHAPDAAVVRTHLSSSPSNALESGTTVLEQLVGARSASVLRRGKRLAWTFLAAGAERGLLVHLGMTGRWIRRPAGQAVRHGRLALGLDDDHALWFEDPRRFGCVVPFGGDATEAVSVGLGPDALDQNLDGPGLHRAIVGTRRPGRGAIKVALMDQQRLAGIGNIQATEALWRAGIAPERAVRQLTPVEWQALASGIRWTLQRTLDVEGEAEVVYLSADRARNPFLVYGRQGQPCSECGSQLQASRLGGRVTVFCGKCQG